VIVWLNGTFGCGKTTTAAELRYLIPSSRAFDPETVGYMLQPNLADHPVTDFQQWPPWRRPVVATAAELARFTGQHLIAPQTVLERGYLDQVFAGAARRRAHGVPCRARCRGRDLAGSAFSARLKHNSGGWLICCLPAVALMDDPRSRPRRGHRTSNPCRGRRTDRRRPTRTMTSWATLADRGMSGKSVELRRQPIYGGRDWPTWR
jgi:hypothetical protein